MHPMKPTSLDTNYFPINRGEGDNYNDLINEKIQIHWNSYYAKFKLPENCNTVRLKREYEKRGWRVLIKPNRFVLFSRKRKPEFRLSDYLTGGELDDTIKRNWSDESRKTFVNFATNCVTNGFAREDLMPYYKRGWRVLDTKENPLMRTTQVILTLDD